MSATVAAALKKIAVALLTDKKALKTIGGIVLGVLIIIIMPIVAVVSLFNGGIEIDTDRLQTMVVENLSAEEQAKLQAVEDTMYAIEDAMLAAGFPARVKEAQVLYVLALSDFADDNGFVEKLVGCFTAEQTDAQLISAVNSAFGTSLAPEDFTQVMQAIRAVYIDTSHYTDPSTKNNLDLVQWAIAAEKAGWGYVWGTFGEVLTESYYEAKAAQYPEEVGGYEDFIRQNWLGGRTADCVGFIKGYGWLNADTHEIEMGCRTSAQTPCTTTPPRKERSTPSRRSPALRSGMRGTLESISGTVRSSMPPAPRSVLFRHQSAAAAGRTG